VWLAYGILLNVTGGDERRRGGTAAVLNVTEDVALLRVVYCCAGCVMAVLRAGAHSAVVHLLRRCPRRTAAPAGALHHSGLSTCAGVAGGVYAFWANNYAQYSLVTLTFAVWCRRVRFSGRHRRDASRCIRGISSRLNVFTFIRWYRDMVLYPLPPCPCFPHLLYLLWERH